MSPKITFQPRKIKRIPRPTSAASRAIVADVRRRTRAGHAHLRATIADLHTDRAARRAASQATVRDARRLAAQADKARAARLAA